MKIKIIITFVIFGILISIIITGCIENNKRQSSHIAKREMQAATYDSLKSEYLDSLEVCNIHNYNTYNAETLCRIGDKIYVLGENNVLVHCDFKTEECGYVYFYCSNLIKDGGTCIFADRFFVRHADLFIENGKNPIIVNVKDVYKDYNEAKYIKKAEDKIGFIGEVKSNLKNLKYK